MSSEKCRSAALRYVAASMRTEGQVEQYLKRREFSDEDIRESLAMLREYRYVDDLNYCVIYYKEACRKGKGRRRIEQELIRKKVKKDVIKRALDELLSDDNPDYKEIMEEVFTEKKRASIVASKMIRNHLDEGKVIDKKFVEKVGRRLTALGYSGEVIYSVTGILMKKIKTDWKKD
ncbi:MAG: regulatory protein RecX [Anaerovoracaceae bacterium]|nr:regulatory protein RecX [Bacillota bacterium]MEE0517357.1 regulatory protein RecX [Anaerovoracaceae bacterium]